MEIKPWVINQYLKYIRVWRILRKPTMQEFKSISKISAIGILIIGAIGFLVNVIITLGFK